MDTQNKILNLQLPNPDAISVGLFVLEEALKLEPVIAAQIQKMFSKGIPTADDWANLRAGVKRGYLEVVPDSQLTPADVAAAEAEAPASAAPPVLTLPAPTVTQPASVTDQVFRNGQPLAG